MEKKSKRRKPLWVTAVQVILVIALLAGMQISVSRGYINSIFLASPTQIVNEFFYMLQGNE